MLVSYTPTAALDVVLLRWYARLIEAGELDGLLSARFRPVSMFLRFFQPPNVLRLDIEAEQVRGALWYSPLLDGAVIGLYYSPEWRHGAHAGLAFVVGGLRWGLHRWPVLIGWTPEARRAQMYQKFGFTLAGAIPQAREGQTVYMLTLTAPQLTPSAERIARHAMANGR